MTAQEYIKGLVKEIAEQFFTNSRRTYSQETRGQTEKILQVVLEYALLVFPEKHEAYGRGNIAKFGEAGVAVRLSDKLERLVNLIAKTSSFTSSANVFMMSTAIGPSPCESLEDTWRDVLGYGAIGMLCHRNQW